MVAGILASALVLLAALLFLSRFSLLAVRHASRLARLTGIGELSIGFVLVSVATSLPELSVAITSALSGSIGITIGNVMGANVANVLLIVGLCAFRYCITKHSLIY